MKLRSFRIALCITVRDAVDLSSFERQGPAGKFVAKEFSDFAETAMSLHFDELECRLDAAADNAARGQFNDEELLGLCLWSSEMWTAYDAERN